MRCLAASPFRISVLTLGGIAIYSVFSFSSVVETTLPANVLRSPAAHLARTLLCDQSGASQRLAKLEAEFDDLFAQLQTKRNQIKAAKASLLACGSNNTQLDIQPPLPTTTATQSTQGNDPQDLIHRTGAGASVAVADDKDKESVHSTNDKPIATLPDPAIVDDTNSDVLPSHATTISNAPITVSAMQEANSKFNSKYNLLEGTRLCRLEDPHPTLGENSTDLSSSMFKGMGLDVRYQCAGPGYDKFTEEHLLKYVAKKQQGSPEWGTRPTIVPSSTTPVGKSMSVLVLGNSHMRQIAVALMCQFRDQFVSKRDFEPFSDNMGLVGSQYTFALGPTANLTLTVMTNHPAVHSVQWKANIEEFLQHPLEQVDALVQGQYNPFLGERYRAAKLWQNTQKYKEDYPQHKVDYETITHGIDLRDMLNTYKGPMVYLSSFAAYNMGEHKKGASLVKEFAKNRTSTKYYTLNARENINSPEMGRQECAMNDVDHIGDCVKNNYWHRCMGDKGGQPDLLAIDLVVSLWKIFTP